MFLSDDIHSPSLHIRIYDDSIEQPNSRLDSDHLELVVITLSKNILIMKDWG